MTEEKIDSIYFLKIMLKDFKEASDYFKDYLTSNSKKSWDLYNMRSLGYIGYAQIMDHKLMPHIPNDEFDSLMDYAETQYDYNNYTPEGHNEKDALKVLEVLAKMKEETQRYLDLEEERLKKLDLVDTPLKKSA